MASILLKTIKDMGKVKHNVGSLNEWNKRVLNQGAIISGGALDNFTLVELGFDVDGNRIATALSATTKMGYLLASVEEYMEQYGETMSCFYNEVGERGRIVILDVTDRFEASNFVKADTGKEIKNGQKAHYDALTKKFIISNGVSNHADYATAANTYVVVGSGNSIDGQELIRFEVSI